MKIGQLLNGAKALTQLHSTALKEPQSSFIDKISRLSKNIKIRRYKPKYPSGFEVGQRR